MGLWDFWRGQACQLARYFSKYTLPGTELVYCHQTCVKLYVWLGVKHGSATSSSKVHNKPSLFTILREPRTCLTDQMHISHNALIPCLKIHQSQDIIGGSVGVLLIEPLGTYLSEISIRLQPKYTKSSFTQENFVCLTAIVCGPQYIC